jgi:hypothetical protein
MLSKVLLGAFFLPFLSLKAIFAKSVRQFGIAADMLPKYRPLETIQITI